jgi:nuclear RNA export factor
MKEYMYLPSTNHPLNEPPEKKLFVFDAFMRGTGSDMLMYIFVHGEFMEQHTSKRSFDRTFVLAPAVEGSAAAAAGAPVIIMNDCLVVRNLRHSPLWRTNNDTLEKPGSATQAIPQYPQLPSPEILQQLQIQHGLVKRV